MFLRIYQDSKILSSIDICHCSNRIYDIFTESLSDVCIEDTDGRNPTHIRERIEKARNAVAVFQYVWTCAYKQASESNFYQPFFRQNVKGLNSDCRHVVMHRLFN